MTVRLMPIRPTLCLLLPLAAACAPAFAQDSANVLYRCTDAKGNLTIQNSHCAQGMREQRQVVGELKTASLPGTQMPVSSSAPAANPRTADAGNRPDPALANPQDYKVVDSATPTPAPGAGNCDGSASNPNDPPRLPPPVLFECTTYDNDSYVSEDPMPPPRRLLLQTTGLGGDPGKGHGEAWELKRDTCVRVPDGKLCDAWRKRFGETEVAWRYGKPENVERNKAEYQRVLHIVNDSACGR